MTDGDRNQRRSLLLAYVLLWLGGILGLHRFYLGHIGWGIIYFFTGGIFGVGVLVDIFTLPARIDEVNRAWEDGRVPAARLVSSP